MHSLKVSLKLQKSHHDSESESESEFSKSCRRARRPFPMSSSSCFRLIFTIFRIYSCRSISPPSYSSYTPYHGIIAKWRGSSGQKFALVRQDDAMLWTKSRQLAPTLKKVFGSLGLRSFKSSDESDQLNDLTKMRFILHVF